MEENCLSSTMTGMKDKMALCGWQFPPGQFQAGEPPSAPLRKGEEIVWREYKGLDIVIDSGECAIECGQGT